MPPKYTSSSRIISGEIIEDRRVNSLNDWLAITAHFRTLLRMDNLGRIEAEPEIFKALIFPRCKPTVSMLKCQRVIEKLHTKGLFFLYTRNGDQYLQAARYERQKMVGHMRRLSALPPPDPLDFLKWLVQVRQDDRFLEAQGSEHMSMVQDILGTCSNHVSSMLGPRSGHVNPEHEQTTNRTDNESDNENDTDTEEEGVLGVAQDDEGVSASALNELPRIKKIITDHLDPTSLPKGVRLDQEVLSAMKIHGWKNVEEAIKEAALRNNPRWQYVVGILVNWETERNSRRKK